MKTKKPFEIKDIEESKDDKDTQLPEIVTDYQIEAADFEKNGTEKIEAIASRLLDRIGEVVRTSADLDLIKAVNALKQLHDIVRLRRNQSTSNAVMLISDTTNSLDRFKK